jgi:hypothetical protein
MVDSAGVLDSQWSGHEGILPVFLVPANKKQGLRKRRDKPAWS